MKPSHKPVYVILTILLITALGKSKIQVSQQGQCPPLTYFYYDPDWKLEGHVVAKHYVTSEKLCYAKCIRDTRCRSLNFEGKRDSVKQSHRCEISYSNKRRHPSSFLLRKGWTYQEVSNDNLPELDPATITSRPSSHVVIEEGQDLTLYCTATGRPEPKVMWERSDGKVINGTPTLYHTKLVLLNVSSEDETNFTCEVNNEVNTQPDRATVTVTVVPVPRFTVVPPRYITSLAGSRVQIDCKGNRGSNITWAREGGSLSETHLKYSNGTLVLMNISQDTTGYYVCRAKTVFRSVTAVTHVLLQNLSCSHLKAAYPTLESGNYTIDPDGEGGEDPFTVYCDMRDKNGVGVTVVSHDSEKQSRVRGCKPPGCFIRNVTYTGVEITQLASLEKISVHCEQFIKFSCWKDVAFIEDKFAWWVSRDGKPMYYWGGAYPGSGKCACGMSGTCARGAGCNCMKVRGIYKWMEDSGLLPDKASLPVTQLRFGDVVKMWLYANYTLGKFKCHSIISTSVPVTIESRPSSLTAEAGQDVVFACITKGHPKPIVSWKRSDGSGLSTVYWKVLSTTLTLLHVTPEDEGTYICETKYGNVTLTASSSLQVTGFTVRPPRLVTVPEGGWVWLPCRATKHSNISWGRENGDLPNNHVQYSNGTLLLMNSSRNDSDVYICSMNHTSLKTKTKILIGNLSCSHLKEAHPTAPSGNYTIDPDGEGGEDPFTVYCNMSDKNVAGVTIVSHNSEEQTKLLSIKSGFCCTCDIRNVTYFGATLRKLGKITDLSEHCEQLIEFRYDVREHSVESNLAHWMSQGGNPMFYWNGAEPGSKKCVCGMWKTCAYRAGCNCNRFSAVGEDSGLLTYKSTLPVKQLRVASPFAESSYALGKFKCYGVFSNIEEGGWTVIQKRFNGATRFDVSREEYKFGFGNLEGEFWLGLNKIHRLTTSGRFILRVELEDWDGNTAFAEYDNFVVGDEGSGYELEKLGRYKVVGTVLFSLYTPNSKTLEREWSRGIVDKTKEYSFVLSTVPRRNARSRLLELGTAGDSLFYSKGWRWRTINHRRCSGGWWLRYSYVKCNYDSNLNGKYGRHVNAGITWLRWKGRFENLKKTEMKIRLAPFVQD